MWVFSGRRGIHCWVCDPAVRHLEPAARRALVSYLEVIKGGSDMKKKVHLSAMSNNGSSAQQLHPSLERSRRIIKKYFATVILKEQRLLDDEAGCALVLQMLPSDEQLRTAITSGWKAIDSDEGYLSQDMDDHDSDDAWTKEYTTDLFNASMDTAISTSTSSSTDNLMDSSMDESSVSVAKWKCLIKHCRAFIQRQSSPSGTASGTKGRWRFLVDEIMFQLVYPRLDVNVSYQLNHLLKAPFCVHPDTAKVCVPLSLAAIRAFDPSVGTTGHCPDLRSLYDSSVSNGSATDSNGDLLSGGVAQLKPFLDYFDRFVADLQLSNAAYSASNGHSTHSIDHFSANMD